MISCILALVTGALVLVADQLTKNYITANFTLGQTYPAVEGVFDLTYIHNKGGAWGMMNSHPWLLLALAAMITIICIMLLVKYRSQSKLMFWALTLVLSGGLGNIIDRIFRAHHSVVDFIDLSFIEFPVFNIADCAVCIGAGLLVLFFLIDIVKTGKNDPKKQINTEA